MNVRIHLIRASDGVELGDDEVAVESLPERFDAVDTHVTVGDVQYKVVGADPEARADIAESGHLRLLLAPVDAMDPGDVRFSAPTLEASTPAFDASASDSGAIALHEDDWRQVELVSAALRGAVDAEATGVRAAREGHEPGRGFGSMHVRRSIPAPLEGVRLPLREVCEALGVEPKPLAIRGAGVVRDGFALPVADALVYGVAPGGVVEALGIQGIPDDVAGSLHAVALRHRLLLVEWCVPRVVRAHEQGFVT